jgi:hypothetical protein
VGAYNWFLPKWAWLQKCESYHLSNAIMYFIGVCTFSKITMSPPDGTDNPTGSWTRGQFSNGLSFSNRPLDFATRFLIGMA